MSTTPMTASRFATVLRAGGVTVVEVGDWETHNRNRMGPWGPMYGVMIHHTVTRGSAATVSICRTGYSSLPGPLCHGVITKNGHVHLVGYGRANHAGLGDDDVLTAVKAGRPAPADNETNTDGNRYFYGFECENMGDGKDPWPAAQLLAIERVSAAICKHHGWNENHVIGHAEWQPGKVDPRGFSMGWMRGKIKNRMATSTAVPGVKKHTIVKGDTLWSLSRTYKVSVNTLRQLNPQIEDDVLPLGEDLKLSSSSATVVKTHTVVKGDTLWKISQKYDVSVDRLRALNPSIENDIIEPGWKVRYQ